MNVGELINKLTEFDKSLEVILSDGYEYKFYKLDYAVFSIFKEDDGSYTLDIGIGGCDTDLFGNNNREES